MTFLNAALLFGLAGMAVPPVVHLFSRKKLDIVDWPAMQFLQLGRKTRRKVFLEQFWLMLLRMVLLGLLALGLAAPQMTSSLFGTITAGGTRDVVILIDGSASMGYKHAGSTAAEAARAWVDRYLERLPRGDRVAIFQVKPQVLPIVPTLTAEAAQARNALELLAPPKGTADWPAAVQAALALLEAGHPNRDIVIVGDDQRYSWADETTRAKWDLIRRASNRDAPEAARIWVVNAAGDRPGQPANWSLDPLATPRGVASANRAIPLKGTLRYSGPAGRPEPAPANLFVDGQPAGEIPFATGSGDVWPLSFERKFNVGSHLVSVEIPEDGLPSDNRQDFALEVIPSVPVLIVDGAPVGNKRGSDFLRDALAPAKDPSPGFLVRTLHASEWTTAMFQEDVGQPGTPPRVLVLFNLERPSTMQQGEIEKFLQSGGSVLVTLGERCDAAAWNRTAYRAGQGFLPARLVDIAGSETDLANAPTVQPASFSHPALDIFKDPLPGGLQTAIFPKRWKVDPTAGANGATGTVIGMLNQRDPWLVERSFGKGRVVLAVHPLDNSWKTNLTRLPDFVRLAHELTYYLAATRSAERNLQPGQPIVFTPRPLEPVGPVAVVGPDGRTRTLNPEEWPLVIDGTTDPGAYKLTTPAGRTVFFAVRNDAREAALTPNGPDDRARVAEAVGKLEYVDEPAEIAERGGGQPASQELWWPLLLLVLVFLVVELWYTRRLTSRGEHNLKGD